MSSGTGDELCILVWRDDLGLLQARAKLYSRLRPTLDPKSRLAIDRIKGEARKKEQERLRRWRPPALYLCNTLLYHREEAEQLARWKRRKAEVGSLSEVGRLPDWASDTAQVQRGTKTLRNFPFVRVYLIVTHSGVFC